MEAGSHLAHRLGVSNRGGEVAIVVQAAKQAAPAVVAIRRVGQAPRHQWLTLTIYSIHADISKPAHILPVSSVILVTCSKLQVLQYLIAGASMLVKGVLTCM